MNNNDTERKILALTKWWALYQKENYQYINSFDDIEFNAYFKEHTEDMYYLVVERYDEGFMPKDLMELSRQGLLISESSDAKEKAKAKGNKESFERKEKAFLDSLEAKKESNEKINKMKDNLRLWWKSANADGKKQQEFEDALKKIPEKLYVAAVITCDKEIPAESFTANRELTISDIATAIYSVKSNHIDFERKEKNFLSSLNNDKNTRKKY